MCVYLCIYTYLSIYLSLSTYIYIYIYVKVFVDSQSPRKKAPAGSVRRRMLGVCCFGELGVPRASDGTPRVSVADKRHLGARSIPSGKQFCRARRKGGEDVGRRGSRIAAGAGVVARVAAKSHRSPTPARPGARRAAPRAPRVRRARHHLRAAGVLAGGSRRGRRGEAHPAGRTLFLGIGGRSVREGGVCDTQVCRDAARLTARGVRELPVSHGGAKPDATLQTAREISPCPSPPEVRLLSQGEPLV